MHRFLKISRDRARKKFGSGWGAIGREFQECAIARELMFVIGSQDIELNTDATDWEKSVKIVEELTSFLNSEETL